MPITIAPPTEQQVNQMVQFMQMNWWGEGCAGTLPFGDAWAMGTHQVFGKSTKVMGLSQAPAWFRETFGRQLLKKPLQKPEPEVVEPSKVVRPPEHQAIIPTPPVGTQPKYNGTAPLELSDAQLNKLADMVAKKLADLMKVHVPEEAWDKVEVERVKPKRLLILGLLDAQVAPLRKEFEGAFQIRGWKNDSFHLLKDWAETSDVILTTKYIPKGTDGVVRKFPEKVHRFEGSYSHHRLVEQLTQIYSEL